MTPKGWIVLKQRLSYLFLLVLAGSVLTWAYPRTHPERVFFRDAEASFRKRDYARAAKFYSKAIDHGLRYPSVFVRLMDSRLASGDMAGAAWASGEALKAWPDDRDVLGQAAKTLLRSGDKAGAASAYERYLNAAPQDEEAAILLAAIYRDKGELRRAEKLYRAVLAQKTDDEAGPQAEHAKEIPDWVARRELARVLFYLKRYEESISQYRKLMAEKPFTFSQTDMDEARVEMAEVMFAAGASEDAMKVLKEAPPEKLGEKGRLLMAEIHISKKEFDMAQALLRELVGKNPSNREARLRLAEVLAWSHKYDESISEYRRALAEEPGDIQARRKYAFVLIWAGRFEEAAEELRKTLK